MTDRYEAAFGIGIDIIEVERVAAALHRRGQRLLTRLFTAQELADCPPGPNRARQLAARFAAKEAVLKSFGRGLSGVRWRDVEVVRGERGKPVVRLHGALRRLAAAHGIGRVLVSLSHSRDYACAQALAVRGA